ncbi:hypothetical protein FNV43_RR03461 [Rhamnella rubrinervis]|uniref:RING-type domain-containing protein n=1 Tax=Rhamnella rubrinervis TaxID=2594499 RepID=A0A8K0HK12_9ROSA|nr:hypothetical protein FNV43_RR03461 [Rhamnella rubrinervis]
MCSTKTTSSEWRVVRFTRCGYKWLHKKKKSIIKSAYQDDEHQKLGAEAREAKERLDERLRTQRKSESKRHNNSKALRCGDGRSMVHKELQLHTEVYCSKRNGSRKFSWAKLSWKASDQDECAVCLERFRAGETLLHLPCAHRFHSGCLAPWLENNAHCPCCRMGLITHH